MPFATSQNYLLHKKACYGQIDRPDNHHAPIALAVKRRGVFQLLRLIGFKNQLQKSRLLCHKLFLPLFLAQIFIDAHIMLTLIPAKIEHLKGTIGLAFFFKLPLYPKQTFSCGMDGELAQICGYPLAAKLFSDCRERSRTAKEIGYEVTFSG